MLTLHQRRRIGRTVTYTTAQPPHAQTWRDAANDDPRDGLDAARGILIGLAGGALCWLALAALGFVGLWAFECFVRGVC